MVNPQIRQQIKGQRQKALIYLVNSQGEIIFKYSNQKNLLPRGCHTEQDLFAKITDVDLRDTSEIVIASTQNPCIYRQDHETCCLNRILQICQDNPHLSVMILYSKPCWSDVRFLANQGKSTQPYQDRLQSWIEVQMAKLGVTNLKIEKLEK